MKLTLDIESYSEENLKTAGLYRYAEHESTDLLCVCWAFDDGPVSAWIPSADQAFIDLLKQTTDDSWAYIWMGPYTPEPLRHHIESGGEIHAWNAAFERNVLNGTAGQRYGFPRISIEQTRCSMARARACSMPGRLEEAANVLDTEVKKNTAGLNAMRYLCKPRADGSRPVIGEERDRFLKLVPYCADDVRAERCIDAVLPELGPKEIRVYHLDQRINDRGVKADLEAVQDLEILIEKYKAYLYGKCKELTGGIPPSQTAKLSVFIRANGYPDLANLQADTVRRVVGDAAVPESVKTILKLYSTYNMKAVAKLPAIRKAVCRDGRLRGMFGYHAAATGRWAAYIVQLHNIFRGVLEDPDAAIEACKNWDLDWIRDLYPGVDPMKVFASCIRGMLIAEEGKELVFPDFSGIEARWVAWLFGEEWKLDLWRKGEDTYVHAYLRAFGLPPGSAISKKQRLIGKVLELSMQYEGGVGAFIKMAKTYGLDMTDLLTAWEKLPIADRLEATQNYDFAKQQGRLYGLAKDIWLACEGLKVAWRRAHPKVVAGWKALKNAANNAVANPGEIHKVAGGRLMFKVEKDFLILRLPSGRRLYYYKPRLGADDVLRYEGVDTETRQWQTTSTYGGKLCENQAQGGCRDLLVDAMLRIDEARLCIVAHVHDEVVIEARTGSFSDEHVSSLMCAVPAWAERFPVDVEIKRGHRYKK
jgi:DNA polymerase